MCNYIWHNRKQFLSDNNIVITGYMANPSALDLGIFTFNHLICKGTFSVRAGYFLDLYEHEIYGESHFGSDKCLGKCMDHDNLEACPVKCECAYVRQVIQIIKQMGH